MHYKIIHLPKEDWKNHILPMGYTTESYYDVEVQEEPKGFLVEIEKKNFPEQVTHTAEEYDFPDKLYQDFREDAWAWGVLDEGKLIAAIETNPEKWSNRLRITELWVNEGYRRKKIGHALMEVAKEQARLERRRAIILETQSCNVNAIAFYRSEGFTLIGLDTCCYQNHDLQRKEVRLELGWFPAEKKRLERKALEIRAERPGEYHATERMTQRAFWNKHHQGCDEHYLVHKLRSDENYLPSISRIAVKDGEVIGCIMYSRAKIVNENKEKEILTFGPLCVAPEWQGCGVGELLLKETTALAAKEGYSGIVIFGEPDYYPRHGFKTCDHFGITTKDGKNFAAFMGLELQKDAFCDSKGKFHEASVFENLPPAEVEEFHKSFEPLIKQRFPGQWD